MRGNVVRQGRNTWGIRISAGIDPVTGKRRRVFRTVRGTRRDAEAMRLTLAHELATGALDPALKRTAVADFLNEWLNDLTGRVRPRTAARYEQLVRCHIVPRLGRTRLDQLRPAQIRTMLTDAQNAGLAPRTVLHIYRVLGTALRQARRDGMISVNPIDAVRAPRAPRVELKVPSPDEIRKLIRTARPDFRPIIQIAVWTGVRRGELLALRWREVDLEGSRIRVTGSLQRARDRDTGATTLVRTEPKSAESWRSVALPPSAITTLRQLRTQQGERRLRFGEAWNETDLVFDRGDGAPMPPEEVSRRFKETARRAGLPDTRFHDLRHGFATTLLTAGVHPKVVSEALGHTSVAFTLTVYSHVLPSMQEVAAQAIEIALGRGADASA